MELVRLAHIEQQIGRTDGRLGLLQRHFMDLRLGFEDQVMGVFHWLTPASARLRRKVKAPRSAPSS